MDTLESLALLIADLNAQVRGLQAENQQLRHALAEMAGTADLDSTPRR